MQPLTPTDLAEAEARYQQASWRAEQARAKRNAAVGAAIAEGWSHAAIAQATGLTRSRVGQIALNIAKGDEDD